MGTPLRSRFGGPRQINFMPKLGLCLLIAAAVGAQDLVVFRDRAETPREQLVQYLNAIGQQQLAARAAEVARLASVEEVEKRKKVVREKILKLLGGLPEYRGPLNVKQYGTLDRGDYRIEKIVYESLPGFYVPANVYVPARGQGPFPAVLMPVGHGVDGKAGSRQIAVGLATKGFIALAYDPLGQGERVQYYDPDLRESKVGGPTAEHSHANGHALLIGDNVARYRIWDGMRGIDYLLTRPDVDGGRIGCTGCSGGGTLTTYISALDDRVKAAAPSCYINSWEELLKGPGPQDAEQSFPNFLSEGLNIGDYVELFAPKPWLIASTIEDFFPLEGARQTYEEARRVYGLYKAEDRLAWHVGPGGHGTPQPSREAIYGWFLRWLKNGEGVAGEPAIPPEDPANLLVTPTGQVADSLGGETVFTLNKKRAADLIPPQRPLDRSRLVADIRELAAIQAQPGGPAPQVTSHRQFRRNGYALDVVSLDVEPGIRLPGLVLVPDGAGPKAAVLAVDSRSKDALAAPGGDLEDLARAGYLVFLLQPRGMSETPQPARSSFLGDSSLPIRAMVVGKNLVGMRVEDIFKALDYLLTRPDVDRSRIAGFGQGAAALALLHAAVLDQRLGRLVLQDCLVSYRSAVDRPVHRGLYEVAIPGVVRRYDVAELVEALKPREVTFLNPVDALGRPMKVDGAQVRGRRDSLRQFLGAGGARTP